jgi:nuclear-control-of-ATPase protein 2
MLNALDGMWPTILFKVSIYCGLYLHIFPLALMQFLAFPLRLLDLTRTILQTLRTHHIPLTPSIFTPSSLRRLFPSANAFRPNALTTALFPHLQTHSYAAPLTYKPLPSRQQLHHTRKTIVSSFAHWTQSLLAIFTLPYDLTWHECQVKRKELEKIRDERAEVLGTLTGMRDQLANALKDEQPYMHIDGVGVDDTLALFVDTLRRSAAGELGSPASTPSPPSVVSTQHDMLQNIQTLANNTLQTHVTQHKNYLQSHDLYRPSRLTLIWPRLLILPPLSVYLLRATYRSRASLVEMANDAVKTLEGFFTDWLLEPVKGIIKTIRAGGEEGVIVTKQGVAADMDVSARDLLAITTSSVADISLRSVSGTHDSCTG